MASPTPVKAARGRLVRDPVTFRPLPTEGDTAAPITVDLDDPHWWRLYRDGDIVVATAATTVTPKAAAASDSKE
jgi:hypothetical protein